jgi:trigger factor
MQVTVESTGKLERRMRVELPADSVDREVDARLKSVGRTAKIKGFRPGKVPPKVVRQRYGKQIREEVLSELMQKSYTDAVIQQKLQPAGGPKIEPQVVKDGKTFAYVATFEVMPEVELRDLDKIKVQHPEVTIGEEDLDAMILKLRHQKATWEPVERASKDGDRVIVDFEGTLKGEPIEGGKGTEVPVHLGAGHMLPDFEKGITGLKAGDEKTIKVKFPKDYHAEELQGKKVDFLIHAHRVEAEILPPEDDNLAEMFEVRDGGMKKFREDVRENMQREAAARVRNDVREQVMNGLIEANPFDIPRTLRHQEMHTMQHEAMRRMGIEDHDQAPPMENFADMAEKRVRLALLVRQLIDDQKLAVSNDDIRARVEEMCAGYENSEEMVKIYLGSKQMVEQIEPMVLEDKAIDWLLEHGKVNRKKISFTEYMNT